MLFVWAILPQFGLWGSEKSETTAFGAAEGSIRQLEDREEHDFVDEHSRGHSELYGILQQIYGPLQLSERNCACARTMHIDKFIDLKKKVVKPGEEWWRNQTQAFAMFVHGKTWKHCNINSSFPSQRERREGEWAG